MISETRLAWFPVILSGTKKAEGEFLPGYAETNRVNAPNDLIALIFFVFTIIFLVIYADA